MKRTWLIVIIWLGIVFPLSQLIPFILTYGHDPQLLVSQVLSAKMQSFLNLTG